MGEEPNRLPTVTLSYAQTLDGRLATATGSSQWISCRSSLVRAHELRARHDAVMVGVGTVCRDDPRLTVRLAPGENPLRVVVDSTLRTPPSAAVLSDGAAGRTVLAVTGRAPRERRARAERLGARVLRLPEDGEGRVELRSLLAALRERGIRSVMVEGGAALITSFLRERLADRLAVCVAPKLLGCGIEAVGELGIHDLGGALLLEEPSVTVCGTDILVEGEIHYPDDPA
ncbi:Riboflavin biosynthesis protein RibD [Rubrobacter xylanophilus DSM 9941]|uniref:RibD family protein n=1 Tax=Rubrobacter xylanophilus TaxID=49319 RepID=UPI001C63CD3A|nr:RibD family protein [Rubrobacter xylanophilus]QYJ15635.1 Riboflavin biosynthesis protein RibD [Rubrobacter xylanophilus DSM 9941]